MFDEKATNLDPQKVVEIVRQIPAVSNILEVISRITGMGFVSVARVTEDRWIACEVLDNIDFGLKPSGELRVETTICNTIRMDRTPVVIDDVAADCAFKDHHTPVLYGFKSYISIPIILSDGSFFGTLCAIDPRPMKLNTPEITGMFKLFAELIAVHIDARMRYISSEASLAASQADLTTSQAKLASSEDNLTNTEARFATSQRDLALSQSNLLDAQNAAELREQFIAILGHDLRNPLAAISGGTELLAKRAQDDKSRMLLQMMEVSVRRMATLIDNLMDFARGRLGGGLPLEKETKSLEPTFSHVVAEIRSAWPDRAIEAKFDLARPFEGDHSRMAQLLSNLLGNAITHGAADEPIRVNASNSEEGLRLSICNGGKAIPAAARERLFQPFYRGEVRSSLQGLGLGLFIVSEIARAHGGTLEVRSDDAETCFSLKVPLQA